MTELDGLFALGGAALGASATWLCGRAKHRRERECDQIAHALAGTEPAWEATCRRLEELPGRAAWARDAEAYFFSNLLLVVREHRRHWGGFR